MDGSLGARAQEPTRVCPRDVEQSDLFVGIYAHRYAFVPTQSDLSITELECHRALELERPIFAFIVDEEFDWKPNFIDRGVDQDKLQASIITATIDIEGRGELLTLNRFIDLRSDGPRL